VHACLKTWSKGRRSSYEVVLGIGYWVRVSAAKVEEEEEEEDE
jgi:N6-adenosine-specific RNA methylase IME4